MYYTLKKYSLTVWKFKDWYFPNDRLKITAIDENISLLVTKNYVTRNKDYKQIQKPRSSQCMLLCHRYLLGSCSAGLKWNMQTLDSSLPKQHDIAKYRNSNHLVTVLEIIRLEVTILFSGHSVDFISLLWYSCSPYITFKKKTTEHSLEEYRSV